MYVLDYTSREARLRRASLLWRIIDDALVMALEMCARFAARFVSDKELFRFLLDIWRPSNALEFPYMPFSFG